MCRIVQPPRCTARMWQRDEGDAIFRARAADCGFEWNSSPEAIDGEPAEKEDHPRSEKHELLIEPWSAERNLGRRRAPIAAARRGLSRKAFSDRGAVRQVILIDASFGEPAPELRARPAAERLTRCQLDRTWRLADDRDAVANGSGHDRVGALEITCGDAFRAGTNACVETNESASSVNRCKTHNDL